MTYDEIIKDITNGLTGDPEKDKKYLLDQGEKYKDHEMNKEILRAIGRMIFDVLPEDAKEQINEFADKNIYSWDSVIQEARFNQSQGNFDKALKIIETALDHAKNRYEDDAVSEYRDFANLFEFVMYIDYNHPQKDVRMPTGIPFAKLYALYGSILIDLHRYKDAQIALQEALDWNPVHCDYIFEYCETFKCLNDMESFYTNTNEAYKYVYTQNDLARYYRNLGYYYYEKKLWDVAASCYHLSLVYDPSSMVAKSELYGIVQESNGKVNDLDMEDIKTIAEEYSIPFQPSEKVMEIAVGYAKGNLDQGKNDVAKYFLTILFQLTEDESIKKIIDSLPDDSES